MLGLSLSSFVDACSELACPCLASVTQRDDLLDVSDSASVIARCFEMGLLDRALVYLLLPLYIPKGRVALLPLWEWVINWNGSASRRGPRGSAGVVSWHGMRRKWEGMADVDNGWFLASSFSLTGISKYGPDPIPENPPCVA